MEQLRVPLRSTRTAVSSGKDCEYFAAAISATALWSSSAPEEKMTLSTFGPFTKERTIWAEREFPWSLVRNGILKRRMSERSKEPSEDAAWREFCPVRSFMEAFRCPHWEV